MTDPTPPLSRPGQPPRRPAFNLDPLTPSAPELGGPVFLAATAVCAVIFWSSSSNGALDAIATPSSHGLGSLLDGIARTVLSLTLGVLAVPWSPLIAAVLTPRLAQDWPPHLQRTLTYVRRGAFITGIALGWQYIGFTLLALPMMVLRPWGIFAFVVPLGFAFRFMVPGALLGLFLGLVRHRPETG